MDLELIPILLIAAIVVAIVVVLLVCMRCYRECEPNHLMVVFGKLSGGRSYVVMREGARFVWPVIQDYVYLSRAPLNVTDENGSSIAVVRVGADEEMMDNAAVNLAGLEREEIAELARTVILESGYPDESCAVEEELHKLGLVLLKS